MNKTSKMVKVLLAGSVLSLGSARVWSQVYNEEQKATFLYPISGWDMSSQDLKREYMGNGTLPAGIQIPNIISASIQIKNDLNTSGTSTSSTSLYRLNNGAHGSLNHGGQFHIKCDNYPQCEAYLYGFKWGAQGGPSYFTNTNYDATSASRGFIKMEYMNTGTTPAGTTANDYFFPIGVWNMHTPLNQTNTMPVSLAGIDINAIASVSASIYSDPVNGKIEVRSFDQRGKPDYSYTPGLLLRGGFLDISSSGPTANLSILGTHSDFVNINGDYNSSMYSHGGYTQMAGNRGWVKVTVSGSSEAKQPYAIKSKFMQIGGWPIVVEDANGTVTSSQPMKNLTLSTLGIAANRIVHAEALILSDPDAGSSGQVRKLTNIKRINFPGSGNINPDGGIISILEASNQIRLYALGGNSGHYFRTGHADPNINRGWVLVDYLAAQCNEGSGYTRSFIGFTSNSDDCHGNYGSGSSAIHVIQTKAADLWNNSDQIAFIHKPQTSMVFTLQVRVDKIENTNDWARAGISIRGSTAANSRHVSMVVTPRNATGGTQGIGLTVRPGEGSATSEESPNTWMAPYWLRLDRIGNTYSGYASSNGVTWTKVGSSKDLVIPPSGSTYYAGLVQTAGNNGSNPRLNTSVYSNLTETANAYFKIENKKSGLALQISGSSTADGGNANQGAFTNANNQLWQLVDVGSGYWRIVNKNSGKSLDVNGNSTADGANVQQWTYNSATNQQFQLTSLGDGSFRITPRHSGKSVEVAGGSTANGANVQQWTYGGATATHQQWYIKAP